jgi:hypothetical protein
MRCTYDTSDLTVPKIRVTVLRRLKKKFIFASVAWERRETHTKTVAKLELARPLERECRRWEDNNKMDLKPTAQDSGYWIRDPWPVTAAERSKA